MLHSCTVGNYLMCENNVEYLFTEWHPMRSTHGSSDLTMLCTLVPSDANLMIIITTVSGNQGQSEIGVLMERSKM